MIFSNQIALILSFMVSDKNQQLLAYSYSQIGVKKSGFQADISVGCVEAFENVFSECFGWKPSNRLSTTYLDQILKNSIRFQKVTLGTSKPGDIIISPTNGARVGHVGILGKRDGKNSGEILSNNSKTGKWDTHIDVGLWYNRYFENYSLPVNIYRYIA